MESMAAASARLPRGLAAAAISGLAAAVLLGMQLPADPATGVTFSFSPFTDEGWSVMGARNQVLLGTWATDEWQLFWAQLPFNVVVAGVFELFGVGIIQARLVSLVCSVAAIVLVAGLVGRRLGEAAGIVAGIGTASCALLLYYGRLALLEPMIVLFLVLGLILLLSDRADRTALRGVAAGSAFALAIGTKPTSGLAILGILAGAALATRATAPGIARRVIVAAATIAAGGIAWALIVIPQPGLFDTILRIWPPQTLPDSLGDAFMRARDYVRGSDRAIGMTAPLAAGSLFGVVLLATQWSRLGPQRRMLAGAVVGWLVVGIAVLLVVSYRPNRYVVQLVPPMAILTAFGFALALAYLQRRLAFTRRPVTIGVAVVAVSIGLAVRGMGDLAAWTARATYRLPEIQAEVLATVTDGHAIQGAGPTMAMRVPVPTIIVQEDVNAGDLYRTHGVRWLLTNRQMTPTWAEIYPEVWAARELLVCYPWPSGEACLIHVP